MKIVILAAPKKFDGKTKIRQDNAINSWIKLVGRENVCLFGDDETKENSVRLGTLYQKPKTTEKGLPLLDSILKIARENISCDYFLFINADIILLNDFIKTAELTKNQLKKDFLMVGRRTDLDIDESIDFDNPETEKYLREKSQKSGKLVGTKAIDYFLFPRAAFKTIPPLRIGRPSYDNIIIYWAKKHEKMSVVDATNNILAIHQNHDYDFVQGGRKEILNGKDAVENLKMVGMREKIFFITESDYRMEGEKIVRNHDWKYYFSKRYLLEVLPALFPIFYPVIIARKNRVKLKKLFQKHD